jgi:hypothetical protein
MAFSPFEVSAKKQTLDIRLQTLDKDTPLLSGEGRERFPKKIRL